MTDQMPEKSVDPLMTDQMPDQSYAGTLYVTSLTDQTPNKSDAVDPLFRPHDRSDARQTMPLTPMTDQMPDKSDAVDPLCRPHDRSDARQTKCR